MLTAYNRRTQAMLEDIYADSLHFGNYNYAIVAGYDTMIWSV